MVWLEIISIRTATYRETLAALDLCRRIRPRDSAGPPLELRVYCSVGYSSDLSVHIRWDSKGGQHGKSPFGLELSSALSHLGFVNHAIWMEVAFGGESSGIPPDTLHKAERK